jgi:hypothetical protein
MWVKAKPLKLFFGVETGTCGECVAHGITLSMVFLLFIFS